MFLQEPNQAQYDLRFSIAGIPVRVHPLFWVVSLLLGASNANGTMLLIWMVALFISILVHELGHALAMRYFGMPAKIVLYSFGGLAIPDVSPYHSPYGRQRADEPNAKIIYTAAGPGAGFVLALFVIAVLIALGGEFRLIRNFPEFWLVSLKGNDRLRWFIEDMLYVNIFWGLVNLLPIFPLDGGQIAREILVQREPYGGDVKTLWLSLITASVIAGYGLFSMTRDGQYGLFIALMFGSLAYSNYQMIQQLTGGGGYGGRPW